MDRSKHLIFPNDPYARPASDAAPIVVDVWHDADIVDADRLVVPAFHRSPDAVEQWRMAAFNWLAARRGYGGERS